MHDCEICGKLAWNQVPIAVPPEAWGEGKALRVGLYYYNEMGLGEVVRTCRECLFKAHRKLWGDTVRAATYAHPDIVPLDAPSNDDNTSPST